jgi:hypothetical protein
MIGSFIFNYFKISLCFSLLMPFLLLKSNKVELWQFLLVFGSISLLTFLVFKLNKQQFFKLLMVLFGFLAFVSIFNLI